MWGDARRIWKLVHTGIKWFSAKNGLAAFAKNIYIRFTKQKNTTSFVSQLEAVIEASFHLLYNSANVSTGDWKHWPLQDPRCKKLLLPDSFCVSWNRFWPKLERYLCSSLVEAFYAGYCHYDWQIWCCQCSDELSVKSYPIFQMKLRTLFSASRNKSKNTIQHQH